MPTETHPIDARANLSLIAAFLLIIGFGVVALVVPIHSLNGSMQGPSTGAATEAVAEFGD